MAEPTSPTTPAEILARMPAAFDAAREKKDLFYYDSVAEVVPGEFPMEVRLCAALGEKSAASAAEEGPEAKRQRTDAAERPSPFRPPYVSGLYVGCCEGIDGEERMSVLLNKYAVLRDHFLLCPVSEEPQSLPPTPPELARTYSFLAAGARARKHLLAFYNAGPGAGASQRWRHVQFVDADAPVEDWVRRMTFEREDRAILHPDLPYIHIAHPLPRASFPSTPDPSADDLTAFADRIAPALMRSLDLAFDAMRRAGLERSQGWNMIMTLDHLHLIPRSAPSFPLGDGQTLDINGLGYAGMLLVKSDAQRAALDAAAQREGGALVHILARCGIPREHGEAALDAEATQHGGAGAVFDGIDAEGAEGNKAKM